MNKGGLCMFVCMRNAMCIVALFYASLFISSAVCVTRECVFVDTDQSLDDLLVRCFNTWPRDCHLLLSL